MWKVLGSRKNTVNSFLGMFRFQLAMLIYLDVARVCLLAEVRKGQKRRCLQNEVKKKHIA